MGGAGRLLAYGAPALSSVCRTEPSASCRCQVRAEAVPREARRAWLYEVGARAVAEHLRQRRGYEALIMTSSVFWDMSVQSFSIVSTYDPLESTFFPSINNME